MSLISLIMDEDKELSIDSVMFEEFIEELLEGRNNVFLPKDDVYEKYTARYGIRGQQGHL